MKNNIVDAIIEIPLNTKNKFEIDETTGKIRLDSNHKNMVSVTLSWTVSERAR